MKKPVNAVSNAEWEAFPIRDLAPGWAFRVEERSVGCYVAEGIDRCRRTIRREGSDPDALLAECAADAKSVGSSPEPAEDRERAERWATSRQRFQDLVSSDPEFAENYRQAMENPTPDDDLL